MQTYDAVYSGKEDECLSGNSSYLIEAGAWRERQFLITDVCGAFEALCVLGEHAKEQPRFDYAAFCETEAEQEEIRKKDFERYEDVDEWSNYHDYIRVADDTFFFLPYFNVERVD